MLVQHLINEMDRPGRTDFYLMQVTREIKLFRAMFNEHIDVPPTLNELKIPFSKAAQEISNPKLSDEESTLQAKTHWRSIMGKPIKRT